MTDEKTDQLASLATKIADLLRVESPPLEVAMYVLINVYGNIVVQNGPDAPILYKLSDDLLVKLNRHLQRARQLDI